MNKSSHFPENRRGFIWLNALFSYSSSDEVFISARFAMADAQWVKTNLDE